MAELSPKDIIKAPGQLMYFTFIKVALFKKEAKYSEINRKVILLNSEASNYFLLGRDNKMIPFIAVQEKMIPWFFEIQWVRVCVSFKDNYLYLINEENGIIKHVLGLKSRKKRLLAIIDPTTESKTESYLSLKVFKIQNKNVAVSKSNILEGVNITVIKDINDIIEKVEEKDNPIIEDDDDFLFINKN